MSTPDILAAGGIVWRDIDGERRIGIVHRPRYGTDTSLPKGKLDPGETLRQCAVREVAEELGVVVRLGPFAGATTYPKGRADKYVFFWEMEWLADADHGPDGDEIVGRSWLTPGDALAALTYASERAVLARVLDAQR